jgi:hypothetical protein
VSDDLSDQIQKALVVAHQLAFETAVRTGTALVYVRNGKTVKVYPPYRYELVPIKKRGKR